MRRFDSAVCRRSVGYRYPHRAVRFAMSMNLCLEQWTSRCNTHTTDWGDMPNRPSGSQWRPRAAFLLAVASISLLTACTAGTDNAEPSPTPTSTSSATSSPATTTPPTTVETPPLVPPSIVASVQAPSTYEEPAVPQQIFVEPADPPTFAPVPRQVPDEPAPPPPPPSAIDSRGFPLGTTCGPVSCTSPDGLTFVNPDAVPNLESQGFDLCDHTYCPPPGFQLPSTGSGAGR